MKQVCMWAGSWELLAYSISTEIALRYAIIIIGALQLLSLVVAKKIIEQGKKLSPEEAIIDAKVLGEVAAVAV
jgi:MFS transporter, YQGE family, putative transporter